jgi:hypothetical protein
MFTPQDLEQLNQKGITQQQLQQQLEAFKTGFPCLRLSAAATKQRGINVVTAEERKSFLKTWKKYLATNPRVVKFVPASGAASRMFKNLYAFLDGSEEQPNDEFIRQFFAQIHQYAFFSALNDVCTRQQGKDIDQLMADGQYKTIVRNLLLPEGLNYGNLPKGLLAFHNYPEGPRTPFEEHLVEGALYAATADRNVNIHFTVSHQHRELFQALMEKVVPGLEEKYNVHYHITFSEQKSSTDTVAATPEGEPFRTEDGRLLFRPGGHGALIENLNDLDDADIIFIKNIDNVVPDHLKPVTVENKQLLAGILITIQHKVFEYLELLDSGEYTHAQLEGIIRFMRDDLCVRNPELKLLEDADLVIHMREKLNRPIRVCGMVPNVAEPGGGPFFAYNSDGPISLQNLESSQIDTSDTESVKMFQSGTHFNPVDLVCSTRDYQGNHFNLLDYIDHQTGFISSKSKDGRVLQALELPGLWNGAMSDWTTIFVEVPIETFNPVKTTADLLRPEHQN